MSIQDEEKTPLSGSSGRVSRASSSAVKSAPLLLLASGLGTFLEFYSFGLIGYFEAQIANAFFPSSSSSYISLLESFSLYGVAFIIRPFGGMFFGYIADKHSRITSLRVSILCMAIPTFLIGCTPTYSTIGWAATAIVFILRLLQGLSAGGEITTALVYIAEKCNEPRYFRVDDDDENIDNSDNNSNNDNNNNDNNNNGIVEHNDSGRSSTTAIDKFMSYFEHSGTNTALYLGCLWMFGMGDFFALLFHDLLAATMDEKVLDSWGWRIPFWISILISIFAIYTRSLLDETEEFQSLSDEEIASSTPVRDTFVLYWKRVIFLAFILIGPGVNYYLVLTFLPIYLQSGIHYGSSNPYAYYVDTICYIIVAFNLLYFGYLSDRKGYYNLSVSCLYVILITSILGFWLADFTDNIIVESLCQVVLAIILSTTMSSLMAYTLVYIEDVRVRSTVYGLSYNLSSALILSNLFDVSTGLGNLSARWGGAFIGIYLFVLNLLGFIGLKWCHANPWSMSQNYAKIENNNEPAPTTELQSSGKHD